MAPALPWEFGRPLDVVEFYSGKARIASLAHLMGYESRAVDLEYDVPPEGDSTHSGLPKRSSFDLCGEAGMVFLFGIHQELFSFKDTVKR